MNNQNHPEKKVEEIIILITLIALLTLTMMIFEKTKNSSFQDITGKVVATANITEMRIIYCNFTLEEGLNLVSFFCIPNGIGRDNITDQIQNLEAIFEYQENSADAWKIYNPSLPAFVIQDLNVMSRTEGYWIIMNAQENFISEGGLRIPTNIPLSTGWNLAGYPTNESKEVNQSFTSILGNFTEARTYLAVPGVFTSYVPGVGGGLTSTEPYKGYWINATTSEVWIVD